MPWFGTSEMPDVQKLFAEFVRLKNAGYVPVLLDTNGNPLHDRELISSVLYLKHMNGPLGALEKYADRACGLGISGELVATVRVGSPIAEWDRQATISERDAPFPTVRPIASYTDGEHVVYLFSNSVFGNATATFHGSRTIDTPEGRFVIRANASTRGITEVPSDPDAWRWPLISDGRRGRLAPLPQELASAFECTPETRGAA